MASVSNQNHRSLLHGEERHEESPSSLVSGINPDMTQEECIDSLDLGSDDDDDDDGESRVMALEESRQPAGENPVHVKSPRLHRETNAILTSSTISRQRQPQHLQQQQRFQQEQEQERDTAPPNLPTTSDTSIDGLPEWAQTLERNGEDDTTASFDKSFCSKPSRASLPTRRLLSKSLQTLAQESQQKHHAWNPQQPTASSSSSSQAVPSNDITSRSIPSPSNSCGHRRSRPKPRPERSRSRDSRNSSSVSVSTSSISRSQSQNANSSNDNNICTSKNGESRRGRARQQSGTPPRSPTLRDFSATSQSQSTENKSHDTQPPSPIPTKSPTTKLVSGTWKNPSGGARLFKNNNNSKKSKSSASMARLQDLQRSSHQHNFPSNDSVMSKSSITTLGTIPSRASTLLKSATTAATALPPYSIQTPSIPSPTNTPSRSKNSTSNSSSPSYSPSLQQPDEKAVGKKETGATPTISVARNDRKSDLRDVSSKMKTNAQSTTIKASARATARTSRSLSAPKQKREKRSLSIPVTTTRNLPPLSPNKVTDSQKKVETANKALVGGPAKQEVAARDTVASSRDMNASSSTVIIAATSSPLSANHAKPREVVSEPDSQSSATTRESSRKGRSSSRSSRRSRASQSVSHRDRRSVSHDSSKVSRDSDFITPSESNNSYQMDGHICHPRLPEIPSPEATSPPKPPSRRAIRSASRQPGKKTQSSVESASESSVLRPGNEQSLLSREEAQLVNRTESAGAHQDELSSINGTPDSLPIMALEIRTDQISESCPHEPPSSLTETESDDNISSNLQHLLGQTSSGDFLGVTPMATALAKQEIRSNHKSVSSPRSRSTSRETEQVRVPQEAPEAKKSTQTINNHNKPYAMETVKGSKSSAGFNLGPILLDEAVTVLNDDKDLPALQQALYRGASLADIYALVSTAKLQPGKLELRDRLGNTPLHVACMVPSKRQAKQNQWFQHTPKTASGEGSEDAHPYYENETLLLVIQLIYNLCPHNIQRANRDGNLPLHLAVISAAACGEPASVHANDEKSNSIVSHHTGYTCSTVNTATPQMWLDIIGKMIFEYPKALHIPNRSGHTPLDLVIHNNASCPELVALIQEEIAILGDTFSSVGDATTLSSHSHRRQHRHSLWNRRSPTKTIDVVPGVNTMVPLNSKLSSMSSQQQTAMPSGDDDDGTPIESFNDEEAVDEDINGQDSSSKPPPILFEDTAYVRMGGSDKRRLPFGSSRDALGGGIKRGIFKMTNFKMAQILAVVVTLVATIAILPKSSTQRDIRVAFVGNSITFVNDLPRFMEALSSGRITQNSCLHGATRLRTILKRGNGMFNKWNTTNSILFDVDPEDELYSYYVASADDDAIEIRPPIIYDYGACTVKQLLLGIDEDLVAYNGNGYLKNDGKNPCILDRMYYQYQKQRYLEMAREQRLEKKQEAHPESVLQLWDFVVLNDQTLVPAIDEKQEQSEQVLKYVYGPLLQQIHARPVLLVTHGYSYNASVKFNSDYNHIWKDLPAFSSALYQGYQRYAEVLSQVLPKSQKPLLAPAGLAYLVIWEENRGMWERLFFEDGFHPSPHATFLIGCVLYATIYNRMPANIPRDVGELFARARRMEISGDEAMPMPTQGEAIYLAKVAERVVLRKHMPQSYIYDLSSIQNDDMYAYYNYDDDELDDDDNYY